MEFDINRVYTTKNAEEAKIGSKGFFADDLATLREQVENLPEELCELSQIKSDSHKFRFIDDEENCGWLLFYLVEEPKDDSLCTVQELAKWLSGGNGLFKDCVDICSCGYCFRDGEENKTVDKHVRIRKWDDPEWHRASRKYMGLE